MKFKRIALIINPTSGSAKRAHLPRIENIIREHGAELTVLRTERAGHATELARQASEDGMDMVIAAGGDGTVNEALNGLINTQTPLGIMPLGTANVLAREVGLPMNPEGALLATLKGDANSISLGHINASGQSRYFCIVAGAGFDSLVVHNVSMRIKKLIGKGAYVLQAIKTLLGWKSREIRLTIDGEHHTCYTLMICNARMYAGSFIMAPEADITDDDFEIIMLKDSGVIKMLTFALAFTVGKHTSLSYIKRIKGKSITIESEYDIQLDGDDFTPAPATVTIAPNALKLVY